MPRNRKNRGGRGRGGQPTAAVAPTAMAARTTTTAAGGAQQQTAHAHGGGGGSGRGGGTVQRAPASSPDQRGGRGRGGRGGRGRGQTSQTAQTAEGAAARGTGGARGGRGRARGRGRGGHQQQQQQGRQSIPTFNAPPAVWKRIVENLLRPSEQMRHDKFTHKIMKQVSMFEVYGGPSDQEREWDPYNAQYDLYSLSRTCKSLQEICKPFFAVECGIVVQTRLNSPIRLEKEAVKDALGTAPPSRFRAIAFVDRGREVWPTNEKLPLSLMGCTTIPCPEHLITSLRALEHLRSLDLSAGSAFWMDRILSTLPRGPQQFEQLTFEFEANLTPVSELRSLARCVNLRSFTFHNLDKVDTHDEEAEVAALNQLEYDQFGLVNSSSLENWRPAEETQYETPDSAKTFFDALIKGIKDLPKLKELELSRFGHLDGLKPPQWTAPITSLTLNECPLAFADAVVFLSKFSSTLESAALDHLVNSEVNKHKLNVDDLPAFPRLVRLAIGCGGGSKNEHQVEKWPARKLLDKAPNLRTLSWNGMKLERTKDLDAIRDFLRKYRLQQFEVNGYGIDRGKELIELLKEEQDAGPPGAGYAFRSNWSGTFDGSDDHDYDYDDSYDSYSEGYSIDYSDDSDED